MFDNVAFNVVIGLVFVYLLYSLLATIVGEMLSTWMGIRARILRVAIERMLNDGYYKKVDSEKNSKPQGNVANFFLKENPEFRKSFAGRFYDYPSVKYLSRLEADQKGLFSQTKPSYITADTFADTLINILSDKGTGNSKAEQVAFCLRYNTLDIQPETVKNITNLFTGAGNDLTVFKTKLIAWFNEVMDRTNGWYKRKVQFILFWLGFMIALLFNVDSISIARILSTDKEARNQLVTMGVAFGKDTSRYAKIIHLNGDSVPATAVIDSGFSHVTKDISKANMVLGLGWHFDSLKKKGLFNLEDHDPYLFTRYQLRMKESSSLMQSANKLIQKNSDSVNFFTNKIKQLAVSDSVLIRNYNKKIQSLLVAIKNDSVFYNNANTDLINIKNTVNSFIDDRFLYIDSIGSFKNKNGKNELAVFGTRIYTGGEKLSQFFNILFVQYALIGFLFTAFAISLGAPFWFGILNKLASLRGSGINPDEKKDKLNVVDPLAPPVQPVQNILLTDATVDAAIEIYADEIKNEPGVVNAYKGYVFTGTKSKECLQVNVHDTKTKTGIQNKYGELSLFKTILLNVIVTGDAKIQDTANAVQTGNTQLGIANETMLFGWGSFGCIMLNNDDPAKKYIVSCYHVMNGEYTWENDGKRRVIKNHDGTIVSDSYQGCLSTRLDTAFTGAVSDDTCNYYKQWKPAGKHSVILADIKKKVSFSGYATSDNDGIIVNNSCPGRFNYPVGNNMVITKNFEDLIAISKFDSNNNQHPVSHDGDSGALVIDENKKAIGIIVGADFVHTYVIKIENIESDLGLTLLI